MGSAILYCFRCNTQLREAQFEQGKAYRIDTWTCCAECAPEAIRQLPPDRVQLLLHQIHAQEKKPAPRLRAGLRESRPMAIVPEEKRSLALLFAGVGAGVVVLIVVVVLSSGGVRPAPPPGPPPKPVAKPVVPVETPEWVAYRKAMDFAGRNPSDFAGQIREFETVVLMNEGTEAAAEARKKIAGVRAREKEEVDRAMAALERELADPLKAESFAAAMKLLEGAVARRPGAAWTFAVEKRSRDLQAEIGRMFESTRERAKVAKIADRAAEVEAAVARVKCWGMPKYEEELKETLAAIVTHLDLDDCDAISAPWKYVGGEEFPGAKGSLTIDSAVKRGGRGSFRLQGDFSGGGAYVGIWRDLTGTLGARDIKEIRVWVRTRTLQSVGIRIADGSDQVHQRHVSIPAANDQWQELVLRIPDLVGGEHWGGANDGKWHAPAKGLGINLGRNSMPAGTPRGEIWFDDIRVTLAQP